MPRAGSTAVVNQTGAFNMANIVEKGNDNGLKCAARAIA
jgi:hypothetical protein